MQPLAALAGFEEFFPFQRFRASGEIFCVDDFFDFEFSRIGGSSTKMFMDSALEVVGLADVEMAIG